MSSKQQQHANFLQSIANNKGIIEIDSDHQEDAENIDEEGKPSKMVGQSRLDLTIHQIIHAVKTPIKEQKYKTIAIENKLTDDYIKRRKLRQQLSNREWTKLNQFCEKKKRELKYLRKQEQTKREKVKQQAKLQFCTLKKEYDQMKNPSSKVKQQSIKREKSQKKKDEKSLKKEKHNNTKITLSETQQLILGLASYLGILKTSLIELYLPITQSQAEQYFLDNAYKLFLMTTDLFENYKKKIARIYHQRNRNLIDLYQTCLKIKGLKIEDLLQKCDEMPEFPPSDSNMPYYSLFGLQSSIFIDNK